MDLELAEHIDISTGELTPRPDTPAPDYSRTGKVRFTKMYPKGLDAITELAGTKSTLQVYLFIIRNCGIENALIATQETIAEQLGISKRTVIRAALALQKDGHIVVDKVGTANVYILNDSEFWKTYEEHKRFSSFRARALVPKGRQNLKKRLTHMIGPPKPAPPTAHRSP